MSSQTLVDVAQWFGLILLAIALLIMWLFPPDRD